MAAIASEIEKQKRIIAETKKKIDDLKAKEAKRILKIAERVGYFEVELSDDQLEAGLKRLVDSVSAPISHS